MYDLNDTIAALSSPPSGDAVRYIIRLSGQRAFEIFRNIFNGKDKICHHGIFSGKLNLANDLSLDTDAYVFASPNSYTRDDLIEFHITGPLVIAQAALNKLLSSGARSAGPGEFTARAYLNGKMDLTQAEAVAEMICANNSIQLAAAQKLLAGRLSDSITEIQNKLIDLISRIEAGLDFSGEDIQFISRDKAVENINDIITNIRRLIESSINSEETISLPSIGIVGSPNAGKSSLLNALLQTERSIVTDMPATTRDVLTGILKLPNSTCAIFDCAGLLPASTEKSILDTLAQNAAIRAIHNSDLILFCVDASKSSCNDDYEIFQIIRNENVLFVATKCDIIKPGINSEKIALSITFFTQQFIKTSSLTGQGLDLLKLKIDEFLTQPAAHTADFISLNLRHKKCLDEAAENLRSAASELMSDNEELAAMFLRNCYDAFSDLSSEKNLDDAILDRIFASFCIGK